MGMHYISFIQAFSLIPNPQVNQRGPWSADSLFAWGSKKIQLHGGAGFGSGKATFLATYDTQKDRIILLSLGGENSHCKYYLEGNGKLVVG